MLNQIKHLYFSDFETEHNSDLTHALGLIRKSEAMEICSSFGVGIIYLDHSPNDYAEVVFSVPNEESLKRLHEELFDIPYGGLHSDADIITTSLSDDYNFVNYVSLPEEDIASAMRFIKP